MALTTLAHTKLLLGITGTSQDAQIQAFINSASARIENWTNRKFGQQDCIEWQDGGGPICARRAPVNSINAVKIVDGSYFQVAYTGPDKLARVDVTAGLNSTAGKLRLTSTTLTTVIPLSGQLTDIVDAINLIPNWSANFVGEPLDAKAAWIPPMAGLDATSQGGPAAVPVCMGDVLLTRYDSDSGICQMTNEGQTFTLGMVGNFTLGGQNFAALGIGAIGAWPTYTGGTYLNFPSVFKGICLDYNGGMNPIPDDVQQTCVDLVQMMMQSAANQSMLLGGESLGGYSYTNAGGASGGKGYSPRGGIGGLLSGYDALIQERLAGYLRFPLAC